MASTGSDIAGLAKGGVLSLNELQDALGTTSSGLVTVEDWGISYNPGTGQLSEYCTVISNDSGNPITGIGMLAYSGDGATLYAAQYTNNSNSSTIDTSIGPTLYNPQSGNQALCVVYGWTDQGSFYLTQRMTIEQG